MIDYFAHNLWQAWAIVAFLCLILELTNGDFFILCFSIGSVFAAIAAALDMSIWVQIVVFALFTIVSLFTVRPLALRYFHKGEDKRISGAEALIGRTGTVTEEIADGGYGRVKIDGDSWKALSSQPGNIAVGSKVKVLKIDSIIITVKKI